MHPEFIKKLVESVHQDHADRSEQDSRLRALDNHRLGVRKRNNIYPNAPNFLEPIIDDNVRDSVLQEMAVLFGSRRLAVFLALDAEATKHKEAVEAGFDNMLRMMLGLAGKLEHAIDTKRSLGYSILKCVENAEAYDRFMNFNYEGEHADLAANELPDIEVVNIFDFVVPTNTRFLREAERCTQLHRYSLRELRGLGKDFSWDNVEEVIKQCQHNRKGEADGAGDDNTTRGEFGMEYRIGSETVNVSVDEVIAYEVYHYDDEGLRMRTLVCPEVPDKPLAQAAWSWDSGQERPWPYAQLRNENRSLYFYDTRGDAELLLDNQKVATMYMNVKGVHMDHFGHPSYRGSKKAIQSMGKGPGGWIPEGVEIVDLPQVNPQFDMSADAERMKAARRTGASQGGFAKGSDGGDKTATQVNAESQNSTRQVNWSGVRDGDPLGDIFMMMWDWLRHNPIALPLFTAGGGFEGQVEKEIFNLPFIVRSVNSSQNANPDFVLQQMQVIGQQLLTSPFLRRHKYDRLLVDQINPQFTDELIVDPEAMGPEGQPSIVQQQTQMMQLIQQGQQMMMAQGESINDLAETVDQLVEYMKATAQADATEEEDDVQATS